MLTGNRVTGVNDLEFAQQQGAVRIERLTVWFADE
jgi:hypothetical protein